MLVYAGVAAALIAVALVREVDGRLLGGVIVLAIATVGLLAGLWFAWLFLLLQAAGNVLVALTDGRAARALAVTVASNATIATLLLLLPTRRYARRGRPRALDRLERDRP